MATKTPDTGSRIDLRILRKKLKSAGYTPPWDNLSAPTEETCRYWPLTRMSILEGLQDEVIDQSVWERFVDLYGPLICAFCRKRVADQDAAEITQEVFWRIFRYVKGLKYDPSLGSFGGWIGQITRNEITQYYERKQKESRGRMTDDVLREIEARTTLGEWEDEYNAWVVRQALQQVRGEVTETTWKLFALTMNGASAQEVARQQNVKVSRIYKARWTVTDRLRHLIQAMSDDYPFADRE
jgi:RNA polymerase sigma factor (sigma-70 family)